MSFRGLIVLLDEAISAADEKGLRKDWQKDMRGLLGAAVKQNKRAYTKRAAMPPAPKKADATKSPADQMKNAQRGNTGSSGSDVEGPKGGNRSSGFSGSLGSLGGGGGGGSSGGGMRGGGSGASGTITLGGGSKEKPKSTANPLRDAMQASKSSDKRVASITDLLKKSSSKDAADLLQIFKKAYVSVAVEEYEKDRNVADAQGMQIVLLAIEFDNWQGVFDVGVTLNMADGDDLKVSTYVQLNRVYTATEDEFSEAEYEADTVPFSSLVRLAKEPSNSLGSYYQSITMNGDAQAFETMLEDEPELKRLGEWAREKGSMMNTEANPDIEAFGRGQYMFTDIEKHSGSVTAMVGLCTNRTNISYQVDLRCKDGSSNAITIDNIYVYPGGEKISAKEFDTILQADLSK